MLYLLKGSRVREYHQQNVTILGAAEGDHVAISYGPRWVQDGLSVNPGDPCIVVFADSPYETFVPVRFAIIERVDRTDGRLDVDVRLGAFVRAGGAAPLNMRWGRYDREDSQRPGRVFALTDENPGLFAPRSLGEQDEAWRHAIDGLAENGYFERSTFARVQRITDTRGAVLEDQPARVGETVQVELELRTPTARLDEVGFFLDTDPEGLIDLGGPIALPPNGVTTLSLVPTAAAQISVSIGLLPEPLLSSRLAFSLTATGTDPAAASPRSAASPENSRPVDRQLVTSETRMLITRLRRDATMSAETWFGLYEDLFLRWDADDPVVLSGFARTAYDIGRFTDCAAALNKLSGRRKPEDDFLYLLALLQAGEAVDLAPLLDRLDLNTDRDFEDLLGALDCVDTSVLETLTVGLTSNVLGEDKLLRFLDRVFPRLQSLSTALGVAEQAAYADPDRGADLLMGRWPDAGSAPERVVELLVEWGARASRLGPYLDRAIDIADSSSNWPAVQALAKQARHLLGPGERARLLARSGEALMLSGSPPMADAGFGLLAEVVADAATRGDLDAAVRHAEALNGFAATRGAPNLIAAAAELNGQVVQALDSSEALREWRSMQDDRRGDELAKQLRGRVLHLVGGQSELWAKDLEASIGFSDVRWHETEKHGNNKTDWANNLDPDRDIVIVLWERIGHAVTTPLKDKCTRNGVPRVESRTSPRDVLAALELIATGERA